MTSCAGLDRIERILSNGLKENIWACVTITIQISQVLLTKFISDKNYISATDKDDISIKMKNKE